MTMAWLELVFCKFRELGSRLQMSKPANGASPAHEPFNHTMHTGDTCMKSLPAILLSIFALNPCLADDTFDGYSLQQANEFRHAWTMDNWDDGGPLMRYVFLNMPEFWTHSVIERAGSVRELPLALREDVATFDTTTEEGILSLAEYVATATVNAAIVLHEGKIVFESYPRMRPTDKHLYMSVSKAHAATLIAILENREQIDTDKPVDTYLPSLAVSGWAGVTVRDVLDMASGIGCLEGEEGAYSDPTRCYYQYEASLGWLKPTADTMDSPFAYIATLSAHRPAGEAFEYTSPNTFVLAWLAETITGRPYADLLATEIWQRMGAESDGLIVAPKNGVPIASGGISSTLRDMARFGLLFTPAGRNGLDPVVSAAYLDNIQHKGRPEIHRVARGADAGRVNGEPVLHNSYQWDFVMEDGDFFKGGYGGQGLYVSPSRDLVIAFFGTFESGGGDNEMTDVARQLATSGLFESILPILSR